MKYLRLIIKNAGRNKRRSILTVLGVAVSIFLLTTLKGALASLNSAGQSSGNNFRVVVRRNTSLADPMPEAYGARIAQVPGVVAVCPENWFGGIYIDEKHFIPQFYVDANTLFDVNSDSTIPPDQLAAFKQERTAFVSGAREAEKQGWKIGDVIELKGTIYQVNPRLTLRGIYHGPDETAIFFHRAYVEEALGRPGQVGSYFVRLDSPASAPSVMKTIDEMFENSSAPTKTETENAFRAGFVSMMGNVTTLIAGIGLVVVFAVTLITANTMALSARERVTEVSVMKAIGFRPGLILTLMLSESAFIALLGGILGAIVSKFFVNVLSPDLAGFLQNFTISGATILFALALAVVIGLLSGGIPAWNASRTKVVDGLRQVV
ncbi:MAG TPA: FtsX-like permease family protein [Blastocatellia bacterium]|nr:FtsX-like permease family protein [Blastocatellia bacterium]